MKKHVLSTIGANKCVGLKSNPNPSPFFAPMLSSQYMINGISPKAKNPFSFKKEKMLVLATRKSENFLNSKLIMQTI